jgi:hypothetical protein
MVRHQIVQRWVFCFLVLALSRPAAHAGETLNPEAAERAIRELYTSNKLFARKDYKAVRAAFARRFEARHQDLIKRAYGDDYQRLTAWLQDNPDIKEDFYTAIDEKHDQIEAALRLFKDVFKQFPDKFKEYYNLAIAVAVTWDRKVPGVYDYRHHQVRTRSTLPTGLIGAVANFQYLVDQEKRFQGRVKYLPWEFLVHVVNHETPADERQWCLKKYLRNWSMIGQCYKHIAYDHDMLKDKPHLEGKEYTLANIREYGGVCAMQADFAARVSKSLGVPAEYIWGQANTGGLHAWVMWVELKKVTETQVLFSLESHGRYFTDQYYTGNLYDPQNGQPILDRDMERRLWLAGSDRTGKRQADLAMRAYALLMGPMGLDAEQRLTFLNKCITLCPHYEGTWLALGRLCREGKLETGKAAKALAQIDTLLKTFRRFPDFTWKVFDDLLSVQKDKTLRNRTYGRLVTLYELAGRADLACTARLKLAGYQIEQEKWQDAAKGLAFTIKRFPGEGRYVPQMMVKLQEVCKKYKNGTKLLKAFYLDVLSAIPPKRGDEVSQYCLSMYKQAITFFRANDSEKVAAGLEREMERIRATGKR